MSRKLYFSPVGVIDFKPLGLSEGMDVDLPTDINSLKADPVGLPHYEQQDFGPITLEFKDVKLSKKLLRQLRRMFRKRKPVKYKDRFKQRACPACGCTNFLFHDLGAEHPEVWAIQYCETCGCVVAYEDNCEMQDIWQAIARAGVRSKKKVLQIIRDFYGDWNRCIIKIM